MINRRRGAAGLLAGRKLNIPVSDRQHHVLFVLFGLANERFILVQYHDRFSITPALLMAALGFTLVIP